MIMAPGDLIRAEDLPAEVRGEPRAPAGAARPPRGDSARAGATGSATRRPGRCGSSRKPPSARFSSRSCARTTGTSRRPRKRSIRRAAISTRNWNSTASSRKSTGKRSDLGFGFGLWGLIMDSTRSQPGDRLFGFMLRRDKAKAGGKSELHRAVRRVTPGQGNLTESGTENIPP